MIAFALHRFSPYIFCVSLDHEQMTITYRNTFEVHQAHGEQKNIDEFYGGGGGLRSQFTTLAKDSGFRHTWSRFGASIGHLGIRCRKRVLDEI